MADTSSTDELKALLASAGTVKDRLEALTQQAEASLQAENQSEAVRCGRKAYDLAQLTGDTKCQAAAGQPLALALHDLGRYGEAIQVACETQDILRKLEDFSGLARNATTMGMIHRKTAAYPLALKCYLEALDYHERQDDQTGIARVRNNIGNVYLDQGDTANALKHYHKVLAYAEEAGEEYPISIALNNIGETHNKRGQFKEALGCLERALDIRRRSGQEQKSASVLVNMAEAHLGAGNLPAALDCALRARDFALVSRMFAEQIEALILLGRVHTARHDYDHARAILGHAEVLAREAQARQKLVEIYSRLSELHQETGNLDDALACARNQSALQEALHQEVLAAANDTYARLLETTKRQAQMEGQLKVASDIQMQIVPDIATLARRPEVDWFAHLKSAREVGGDFYDVVFLDDDRLYLCVGDVSDKDVGAALFMAMTHTLLRANARTGSDAGGILTRTNSELAANNPKCMFVTAWLGILSLSSGTLDYADAGHYPPLLLAVDGPADWLTRAANPALGLFSNVAFSSRSVKLRPGDALCVYTDGVTEAFNKEASIYSDVRLRDHARSHGQSTAKGIVEHVLRCVEQFVSGAPQSDDITLLSLIYRGAQQPAAQ